RGWSSDIGILDVVRTVGTWLGVLAFGLGYTLAATFEPLTRRRVVAEPPNDASSRAIARPSPGNGREAGEPFADVHRGRSGGRGASCEQRDVVCGAVGDHVGRRGGCDVLERMRRGRVADDRELTVRREVLVERDERPAERRRHPRGRIADET